MTTRPPTATLALCLAASVCGLALAVLPAGPTVAQSGRQVDLELVLAVDTSSSVSAQEFDLQMRGLATAFRDPAVGAAIQASGDLGIAVAMVQWSDNRKQTLAIEWTQMRDAASAAQFSEEIENTPRFLIGGGTALGDALSFSMNQFEGNGFRGRRQVIDISGDGRTNQGAHPSRVRDRAVDAGITINGLAILNEDVYVDRHYQYNVVGGTGAFVMSADSYEDFATAILEKLVKEIAGVPIAARPLSPGAQPDRGDPS